LDPEIHTYYLMDTVSQKVPQALQFLGDGRDAGIASGDSAALADMVRFRSAMTSAAVASDQIRNSVKRAVESYVALDGTVGPAAQKAQDAIERVVHLAETGIPDTTTSSDPASPESQFKPSAALEPPGRPPLPALHDPMDSVSARVPAVAGATIPSGTAFEIRDVSAWREATGRAVEGLATTADESATALSRHGSPI
jgi:hypothetical protein